MLRKLGDSRVAKLTALVRLIGEIVIFSEAFAPILTPAKALPQLEDEALIRLGT
jgi:hypothetical protein